MTTPYSLLHSLRSSFSPLLKSSKFLESGLLTPEEFIKAGDFLTFKCPTWEWSGSGNTTYTVPYLPPDKQFLVSRNVPCLKRVEEMGIGQVEEVVENGEWSSIENRDIVNEIVEIGDDEFDENDKDLGNKVDDTATSQLARELEKSVSIHDIPDDYEEVEEEDEDDPATFRRHDQSKRHPEGTSNDKILKTRTYTLYITYDKVYQVPRLWLSGFNELNHPLTPTQILQDISESHAKKTVTLERFPFQNWVGASIHPCRHGEVMKNLVDRMVDKGDEVKVEYYLLWFLKFMTVVLPSIEYDFTG